jgi:hypothetical protein
VLEDPDVEHPDAPNPPFRVNGMPKNSGGFLPCHATDPNEIDIGCWPLPAMARIFISHSSFDPPSSARDGIASTPEADAAEEHAALALDVRDKLATALRAAKHAVLLDKQGLGLGDRWRSVLNLWIGGCDAAVVILSQKALGSTYVAYEASILSHRHSAPGSSFQLIPVFIPPVDRVQYIIFNMVHIYDYYSD